MDIADFTVWMFLEAVARVFSPLLLAVVIGLVIMIVLEKKGNTRQ